MARSSAPHCHVQPGCELQLACVVIWEHGVAVPPQVLASYVHPAAVHIACPIRLAHAVGEPLHVPPLNWQPAWKQAPALVCVLHGSGVPEQDPVCGAQPSAAKHCVPVS